MPTPRQFIESHGKYTIYYVPEHRAAYSGRVVPASYLASFIDPSSGCPCGQHRATLAEAREQVRRWQAAN